MAPVLEVLRSLPGGGAYGPSGTGMRLSEGPGEQVPAGRTGPLTGGLPVSSVGIGEGGAS